MLCALLPRTINVVHIRQLGSNCTFCISVKHSSNPIEMFVPICEDAKFYLEQTVIIHIYNIYIYIYIYIYIWYFTVSIVRKILFADNRYIQWNFSW